MTWRTIINTKIRVAAETSDPELAVLGTEIKDFDLESINPDELSERFQCLVGQFNFIEVIMYSYDGKTSWVVVNRQFHTGQVIDMGIVFDEITSQVFHAYDDEADAQRCALATVACYLGQPDMIVDLINE